MSGIRPSGGGGGGGGAGGGDDGGGGVKLLTVHYVIANAHAVSFPESWPGSTVCYTSGSLDARDDDTWRRNLDTRYVDGKLTWTHVHSSNGPTFFAYWPPYTYDRHLRLISDCSAHITTSAARGGGGGHRSSAGTIPSSNRWVGVSRGERSNASPWVGES